ncbi:hypothetical protein AXG93_673s1710 [Marchantia polymorpha subsp. ruderalis]|uniref:Uncharacterized protein n=1 Tax=Marchantia polymorpha subsp. ruderalis TaxID=1480154 RepID=A0A176WK21_MARPO|nr:hypothetical protein AXG93_673s1710 [Marchantia polymorpha subsp. ruderalis]
MVDNGVPQSIETQCDDGTYAASKTVKNDLHGNMAVEIPPREEIADDEEVLGVNEVVNEKHNIELAPPSAKADKLEEDIEERPTKKRRKLQRTTTLEIMGPLEEGKEREVETEIETSDQCLRSLEQPPATSIEDLWPSGKETSDMSTMLKESAVKPNSVEELLDRMMAEVKKTIAEQPAMPSYQVFSGIVDLDCSEGT